MSKFATTSCSKCGAATGPGNSGHSSCATHKPRRVKYHAELDTRISGIPCGIRVDRCFVQEPMGRMADSDWDCYGFEEIEFTVLDTKGYEAPWLQAKLTDEEIQEIQTEILESRKEEA